MVFTWVLVEDGQIVCAFTQEPTTDEILDVCNDMTGADGIFYEIIENAHYWICEEQMTEFTLIKTELL